MKTERKQRYDDVMVAQLIQRFDDFIERYDRDWGAADEREKMNISWKEKMEKEMKVQSEILNDIQPIYVRGKWMAAVFMVASIGIAATEFWKHFRWGP